jgi:beta-lactam-binding protein with PASTA domain
MGTFKDFLKSKLFFKQLFRAVVIGVVAVLILLQLLRLITRHGKSITVPNLIGMELQQATDLMEDTKLTIKVMDSSKYDPNYPKYAILDQSPKAFKEVKAKRKIYVSINPSGYAAVSIPDIIQITKRNAISKLNAVGLQIDTITYIPALGKDMVYAIKFEGDSIAVGAQLPRMSKIELVCGDGTRTRVEDLEEELEEDF